ncbi:hybrid sensor histidine kinase/response regulator transcription factor [Sabulibacter ruber]|uniref:hybrid sensor histidine kinase/response regulator transcription factor n=1 Tax=Sabulibacter ruber TaxID=2811901 RepID=UPI001A97BC11|nr:two-component regulator propeller domain-containing protein [Sabulibacter ruber]
MRKNLTCHLFTPFKQLLLLWLTVFSFLGIPLHAQTQTGIVKLHDAKNLSSGSVTSVAQDQDGFIWIGTKNGLSRYDGNSFRLYNHSNGKLGADDVSSVFVDSRGRVWAGTIEGLQLLNKRTDRFTSFRHQERNLNSISSDEITTVFEDSDKQIWVGTERGLNRFLEKDSSFVRYQTSAGLSHNSIKAIHEDPAKNLWVGTFGGGLNKLERKSGRFVKSSPKTANGNSLSADFINVISSLSGTELLLGTSGDGLLVYNTRSGSLYPFFRQDTRWSAISIVRSIFKEKDGTIWVGTDGSGLLKISDSHNGLPKVEQFSKSTSVQNSLSSNAIYSVFADRQGNVWVGTAWNGINVLKREDDAVQFFYSDFKGLNPTPVLSIYKEQGKLWLGTDGNGLNIFNQQSAQVTLLPKNKMGGDYVQLIRKRKAGGYFIGTFSDGLILANEKADSFQRLRHQVSDPTSLPYNDVRDIVEEENGNFWVATWGGGLSYFDKATGTFNTYRKEPNNSFSLSSDNVTTLAEDGKGNLWVGTYGGGLNFFDISTKRFFPVKSQQEDRVPLRAMNIVSMLKDSRGYLWIGTWGQGLNRFDPKNQKMVRFHKLDGISEKTVTALVEDEAGNIWLSTKNGILKYEYRTGAFQRIGSLKGSYHINSVFKAEGRLYFGGNEGVVSFDPRKMSGAQEEPNVKFTGLKLFNKDVQVGDKDQILDKNILDEDYIELKHNHSLITFEFTALDFPFANYEYAIQLENFDQDWREIGSQREATFTNLAPGSYTFKVKARVPGASWGEKYAQIQVLVHKPFWKTWWAFLFYFVVFSVLLYLFYRYTIHLEKLKNNLHLEKINREKEQELNNLKLQFFTDVSHEIRTPVTLIMGSINRITEAGENGKPQEAVQELKKNSSHLLQLVNELLDFRKIDAAGIKLKASESDFVTFVQEIYLSFSTLAQNRHIDYQFHSSQEQIDLWFDKEQMEKVVYNLLSNAFKFTDAGGTIKVEVVQNEHNVILTVEDTGKGISETKFRKIFKRFYQTDTGSSAAKDGFGIGLSIVKRIVKLHMGKIFVESEPGKGSKFSVKLMRGESHLSPLQKVENLEETEHLEQYLVTGAQTKEVQIPTEEFKGATVLVVEDNADIRNYLLGLLAPSFQVLGASNGVEGFDLAISQTPDLIISDIMMPEKDGITLTRELKKDLRTSHIPVILLTARTSFIYRKEGLETGADDFITKPFSETLLKTRVVNLLRGRQALREKFQLEVLAEPKNLPVNSPDQAFMAELTAILDANLDNEELGAEFISRQIGISHSVVYKKIKSLTGLSLVEFVRDYRLKRAAQLLKDYELPVTDVCYKVGFSDRRYFSQMFKKKFGVSPSAYGKDPVAKPVAEDTES